VLPIPPSVHTRQVMIYTSRPQNSSALNSLFCCSLSYGRRSCRSSLAASLVIVIFLLPYRPTDYRSLVVHINRATLAEASRDFISDSWASLFVQYTCCIVTVCDRQWSFVFVSITVTNKKA